MEDLKVKYILKLEVLQTLHNPSTHFNYTHSAHSYHPPLRQESERFRLAVHYGCLVLMCGERDIRTLTPTSFLFVLPHDLKLWSSHKRLNRFLEATKKYQREWKMSRRLKKYINQKWRHVTNWGFRGSGAGCMGSQGFHFNFFSRNIKFLVWFSSENNSTRKAPCARVIYNLNMQTLEGIVMLSDDQFTSIYYDLLTSRYFEVWTLAFDIQEFQKNKKEVDRSSLQDIRRHPLRHDR